MSPPLLVLTTNYDDALERAFEAAGEPYRAALVRGQEGPRRALHPPRATGRSSPFRKPNEYAARRASAVILKLHGAVDRVDPEGDSYVITEDDYIDYLTRSDIAADQIPIRCAMAGQPLPVPRLHLRDWNLRVILSGSGAAAARPQVVGGPARAASRLSEIEQKLWRTAATSMCSTSTLDEYVDGTSRGELDGRSQARGMSRARRPVRRARSVQRAVTPSWFFGREHEVELIMANLRASRLTLLYGASGVGKSSVLLAGVVAAAPRASSRRNRAMRARRAARRRRARRARRLSPSRSSATGATSRCRGSRGDPRRRDEARPARDARACERRSRCRPSARYSGPRRTLLVILDQFEEYFLYHPTRTGPVRRRRVPAVVNDVDLRVHFLLLRCARTRWAKLDRFKGRIPDLFGNYLRLDYLDRDAGREAIDPAGRRTTTRRSGGDAPRRRSTPALVEAVLDDVRTGRLALTEGRRGAARRAREHERSRRLTSSSSCRSCGWRRPRAGHELTWATFEQLGAPRRSSRAICRRLWSQLRRTTRSRRGRLRLPRHASRTKIAQRASDLALWAKRPRRRTCRGARQLAARSRSGADPAPPRRTGRYELYHDVLAEAVHDWASRNQERRRLVETRRNRLRRWRRRGLLGFAWVVCAAVAIAIVQRIGGADPRGAARL